MQVPVLLNEANNEMKRYNSTSNKGNKQITNTSELSTESADILANILENEIANINDKTAKKWYPSYSTMIENYAVILAPFYQSNAGVKQYFDKVLKVKNENVLLNICLIANENKIPIIDTIWKYFSNNFKTKIKLYNELNKINQLQKFDKQHLSQIEFCKNAIELDIIVNTYGDENESIKLKNKPDSIYFLKKEKASNKYETNYVFF